MVQDVRAARRFLSSRAEVTPSRIGIAGASIGATLAALASADDPSVVSLALLSPSLDYRGLRLDAAMKKYGAASGPARRERRRRVCGADGAGPARRRAAAFARPPSSRAPATARRCWRAMPISAAACWSGSDERCYDREPVSSSDPGERSTRVTRFSDVFGVAGVFFGILVGWIIGSQQGAAPRPATRRRGRSARHPVRQSTAAPLDESRAATLAQTRRNAIRATRACGSSSATSTSMRSASRTPRDGTSRRSRSSRATSARAPTSASATTT